MNTNKLSELMQQVAEEKKRLAAEVRLAVNSYTFDKTANDAEALLAIAQEELQYQVWYQLEYRSEMRYGWEGQWSSDDEKELSKMEADLIHITEMLDEVRANNDALMPF